MTLTPRQARQVERVKARCKGAKRTLETPPGVHLLRDDVAMEIPSELNGGTVYLIISSSGHVRQLKRGD